MVIYSKIVYEHGGVRIQCPWTSVRGVSFSNISKHGVEPNSVILIYLSGANHSS